MSDPTVVLDAKLGVRLSDPRCPKCGHPKGLDVDPTSRIPRVIGAGPYVPPTDWLEWSCQRCGYSIETKPVDMS